jgi:RNA recognition motif-containing protein
MSQNNKLYVGNLAFATDDAGLASIFAEIGNVTRAQVVTDRETGRSRGFGFVEMETDEQAAKAVQSLDGATVEGRKIVVNIARPREDRGGPRGGGGGGGGRGGDRGGRGGPRW